MRTKVFFCALAAGAPFAQPLYVGIVGGVNVTEDFQNQANDHVLAYSTPKRWIAGGMAGIRLPWHVAIEIDCLYHELEFTNAFVEPTGVLNSVSPAPVVTWEFPVLAKYYFSLPATKMESFVEAGPTFRTAGNLNGTFPSNHGLTAGIGAAVSWKKIKVAPAIRYSRWARDEVRFFPGDSPVTKPDQIALLVGIFF